MVLNSSIKPKSLWTDWRILLWNGVITLGAAPILAKKLRRLVRSKDHSELDTRRWTLADLPAGHLPKTTGKHVVFAGASYGEMLLIETLTKQMRATETDAQISWLLRDEETLDYAHKNHPEQDAYYWPFDFIFPVEKFFRDLKPDILVLIERFRFPNLVCGAVDHDCKVVLVNGRIRKMHWLENTFLTWFYRWILGSIDIALMQTDVYAERAKRIVGDRLIVTSVGDIKEELPTVQPDFLPRQEVQDWLSHGRTLPLLAAGSTDGPIEEAFVLEAFQIVLQSQRCKLLLAPRKLDRRQEVTDAVQAAGLTWSLRSENDSSGDVLILDTLGDLATAYGSTVAAYVGGALDGMGHNVLEPIAHGIPVSYGMRRGHFGDMQVRSEEYGVGFRVSNPSDLAAHWLKALSEPEFRDAVSRKSHDMLSHDGHSVQATTRLLCDLVEDRQIPAYVC